ncbi:hypothetical protein [Kingella oralis]|uniref:hypothetical protein n=1 Tax=Kingella oralis TaxID=505 RepID=UPI0034E38856
MFTATHGASAACQHLSHQQRPVEQSKGSLKTPQPHFQAALFPQSYAKDIP